MNPGLAITHFFVLLVAASTCLLLRAAAERRFDPPAAPPGARPVVAPRCYALRFAGEDSVAARWVPLRSPVCLTATPAARDGAPSWFIATLSAPDTGLHRRPRFAALGQWRPARPDSLDVRAPGWPVAIRLRLPATDSTGWGRLTASGDASFVIPFRGSLYAINWPAVYRVRVRRLEEGTPAA